MRTQFFTIFLEPDAGNGQGGGGASPAAAPAPAAAAPAQQPASQPAPTTASAGASGGSGGGQPPAAPSAQGFAASNSPATAATTPQPGASQFSGPTQAQQPQQPDVATVLRQLPAQYQQLLQMGYQAAMAARQQPQQQQARQQGQQPQNPFGIPSVDFFGLRNYLRRDAEGNLIATPDAPLDAPQQFKSYVDAFEKAQHQFFQNPQQFLAPLIQQEAARIAQQQFEQNFGRYQTQAQAQTIYQQIADWAVAKDANGQPVWDTDMLTGQRTERLTPAGQIYKSFLNHAAGMGINSPTDRHTYAAQMTQAAIVRHQQQQAAATGQGQQAAQQFVQQAAAQVPNPAQPTPSNAPVPQPQKSLREQLAESLAKNGINDKVLEEQMRMPSGAAA